MHEIAVNKRIRQHLPVKFMVNHKRGIHGKINPQTGIHPENKMNQQIYADEDKRGMEKCIAERFPEYVQNIHRFSIW